ncbi:hypothetical protein PVAND_014519 [Polypedilum vanderplanki]|uniref:Uncharacterized protein n=1 Tax=Polypedilum vanderplanki TaxID=319348 RepID=A0A9J6BA01_POLVA|nr:hypothetical protein PVAND_014519 [Polypedilum vanderplanki]
MDKLQTERFWKKVDQISYGIEPILRYFLEANGFTNFSSFLHTSFDEYLAEKMVQRVRNIKPGDRHYKSLKEWFDGPLENFKLLEGWKSSLRTVFITMNSCDPKVFAKSIEPTSQDPPAPKPVIVKTQTMENNLRKMRENDSDPNFVEDLKEKFQTKIFTKLQEMDSNCPWNDHKEIPLNFVCDFENGKKFEAKCPYCAACPVVYYRYQQSTGSNSEDFYTKLNNSNYFKHVGRHLTIGGNRNVGGVKRRAEDSLDSNSEETNFLRSHIKIEEPEW